jgi:hypothetical protein
VLFSFGLDAMLYGAGAGAEGNAGADIGTGGDAIVLEIGGGTGPDIGLGATGEIIALEDAGADVDMLYPDGVDEAAVEVFEEPDDIRAEMSSGPLSGRTLDDEPMCTVFAYDEMYLGRVSSSTLIRQTFGLTSSVSQSSSSRHPSL